MINITLPDNSVKQYEAGVTPMEVARDISEGLARNVLAAKVNGEVKDATLPINEDVSLSCSHGMILMVKLPCGILLPT